MVSKVSEVRIDGRAGLSEDRVDKVDCALS